MISARVCLRLPTIEDQSEKFLCWGSGDSEKYQSVSGVTTICVMQCDTFPLHAVDQVVDSGLWNVGPLFNGCAKLRDIGGI